MTRRNLTHLVRKFELNANPMNSNHVCRTRGVEHQMGQCMFRGVSEHINLISFVLPVQTGGHVIKNGIQTSGHSRMDD